VLDVQVLVSTMNQVDLKLFNRMNILSDVLFINQSQDVGPDGNFEIQDHKVTMITVNDKGLSKSRNMAISKAVGDICLIADDDLVYESDYVEKIKEVFSNHPGYDIIVFDVESTNSERPTTYISDKIMELGYLKSLKVASFRIAFRRDKLEEKKIKFNELFGAGAKYPFGEENIFLFECIRNDMKILYAPVKIARVSHEDSTWFRGRDKNFFIARGAGYYAMSPKFSIFFILQFAIRKMRLYIEEVNFISAIRFMMLGRKEYKNLMKR